MNNMDDKGCKTPDADLLRMALEHYEKISMRACEWYSVIPRSIEFYFSHKNKIVLLERQRDAALKLAQKWKRSERRFDRTGGNLEYYAYNGDRCAAELRAIFEPKDEK